MSESEDVVVLPVGVVAKGEVRIVGAHLVDPIAADEADVVDAVRGSACRVPIEQALALHLGKAFRRIRRGRHEAATASGADDDGSHGLLIAKRRAGNQGDVRVSTGGQNVTQSSKSPTWLTLFVRSTASRRLPGKAGDHSVRPSARSRGTHQRRPSVAGPQMFQSRRLVLQYSMTFPQQFDARGAVAP